MKGQLVVILGPTGSGKSTQGELLAKHYGWVHLSSGELLRSAGLIGEEEQRGELAPERLVEELVEAAVVNVAQTTPILLDGFPRELHEAHWLEAALKRWGRVLNHVIVLDIQEETIRARLKQRDRGDDSTTAIDIKLEEYRTETIPVIEYFHVAGLVVEVSAEESADAVQTRIEKALAL